MASYRFAIDSSLDLDLLGAEFARGGSLQIEGFLANDGADALHRELLMSPHWGHVINAGGKVFESRRSDFDAMSAHQRETVSRAVIESAAHGFQFRYDRICVPDGAAERARQRDLLGGFARFLSERSTLDWIGTITGIADISFADAQATRYCAGDFLTCHDDAVDGKDRRLAYVLGLTPEWQVDWGGLLLFRDTRGSATQPITPRFNALSLFTVPQPHSVSYVAPFAQKPRLSITGWLRAEQPPP